MNPNDGLFSAAKERELQSREHAAATAAATPTVVNASAGLFSAEAERALGGLPEAKKVAAPQTRAELDAQKKLKKAPMPVPVILIAAYKILTSLALLLPAGVIYFLPESALDGPELQKLLLLRSGAGAPLLLMTAVFGIYSLVVGFGLLFRWKWSRRVVMGGALLGIMYGVRYLYVTSVYYGSMNFPGVQVLCISLLFELTIFLTMKIYPGVREVYAVGAYEK